MTRAPRNEASPETKLELTPIGVVRSPFDEKREAPRQPSAPGAAEGTIELFRDRNFEHALDDIDTFKFIWVLFWFDRAEGYRPKVLPPRSEKRRGVFATRSPHRPNPIGMSLVELVGVDGLVLRVRDLDLLDGTPVLDLKPYLPYADSRADAGHGWVDEMATLVRNETPGAAAPDPLPAYAVEFSEPARTALALLKEHGVELEPQIRAALATGPAPHPYRRIRRDGDALRLAVKNFRVRFSEHGRVLRVESIGTGYRPKELAEGDDAALALHRKLFARLQTRER